jgi:large subunit ribosomal protein L24
MAMQKIKQGDEIIVITGRDKDQRGSVKRVIKDMTGKVVKVLVDGINMKTKHQKVNPQTNEGGLIKKEAPLDVSNVALFNPITKKGDRVGIKALEDGKKVRYFKSNGELVDI